MGSSDSVTHWIEELQRGNLGAAQPLWEQYFERLVDLARHRLPQRLRRAADEEDVALSAFHSLCRGVREGRFPNLADRDDLWRLLVVITAHKAIRLVRDQRRQKRGGGVLPENDAEASAISEIVGHEPTPEFAAQVAEEFGRLLDRLGDRELCSVAVWRMEGDTNEQIAGKLGCAIRTVERRLSLIRRVLEGGDVWRAGT
jgi:DNA-directed RNA polymerase specialized sigma24 family protein